MFPITTLGNVVTVKGGKRLPKGEELVSYETPHPYIRAQDIGEGRVSIDERWFVSERVFRNIERYTVSTDDVCVTIVGANIGDVGIVPSNLNGANLTENAVKLSPSVVNCYAPFLNYSLQTQSAQQKMQNFAAGAAQPKLGLYKVKEIHVPLPPLPTQKKIASILSAYDDLIENNTRRIKILEEMAQAIYKEWFVHFRYPGHENVPMVDSELGQIPQGWEVVPLGHISEKITKGTTPTTLGMPFQEQGINFFKVESIDDYGLILEDKLAHIDESTHDALQRSQLRENDLLFSIAGAIGRVSKIPGRLLPANTNQALAIIRLAAQQSAGVDYFFRVLRSDRFLHYSLGRVVQTAQVNVSLGVLNQAPVLLPHIQTLSLFSEYVFPLAQSQESLIQMNQNLRKTRDLLLPRLISGRLDVEELEIKGI